MSNAETYLATNSFPTGISDRMLYVSAAREYARLKSQEENAELVEMLKRVDKVLDGLNVSPISNIRSALDLLLTKHSK